MKFRLGKSILILFFWATTYNSCNHQTELEGPWIGCEIRKPCIDWNFTIRGNQFHLIREDSFIWYKGRFQLNNNCALNKIDLQIHDTHARSQNGKTILGIYEINSDTLTVVMGIAGKQARPGSFEESRGVMVFNFVRS